MRDFRLNTCLALIAVLACLAACFLGATEMSPNSVFEGFLGVGAPENTLIIWEVRLPRALAAFATGAALGMSGAALQGLLRNPLAEPITKS